VENIVLGIVLKRRVNSMSNFLLGMLVMWFVYPLVKISRRVVTDKFQSFMTIEIKEDVDETTPMGFKLSGDV